MMRNALLAAGIAMSSAAQLRLPGLPLGPGEFCLALWLVLSLTRALAGAGLAFTGALRQWLAFWIALALSLSVGAVLGLFIDDMPDVGGMLHDTTALCLMAAITILASAEPDADRHLRQTAWFLVAFSNLSLAASIALGSAGLKVAGVNPCAPSLRPAAAMAFAQAARRAGSG